MSIDNAGNEAVGSESLAESATSEPVPIEIGEDTLVKLPGQDKPVKYGEYFKGFQGQFTKASQRASELEKSLDSERSARTELERRVSAAQQQGQKVTPTGRQKLIESVKAKTFLSGEEAASMVDGVLGEMEGTIGVRDQAIKLIAQKLMAMDTTLSQLSETHTSSSFQSKIQSAISANGLPAEATDWAEALYLSYEPGAELDAQFPALLKKSWDQVTEIVRSQDKKRVETAKAGRFPGKGGSASAGKPLDTSRLNARDTANAVWEHFHPSET